jgi:hypothetical protein
MHLQDAVMAAHYPSNTIGHSPGLLTRGRTPEQTPEIELE